MKIRIDTTISARVDRTDSTHPPYYFRFDGDEYEIEIGEHIENEIWRFNPKQLGELIEFARFCQSTQAPDTGKVIEL